MTAFKRVNLRLTSLLICFTLFSSLGLWTSPLEAQLGRLRLPFGKKPPKVEQTNFELTQQAGPWMIMAASFVGDDAEMHAEELCEELQKKLNAPVYIYKHTFDFTNKYEGFYYSATDYDVDANGNRIPKRKPTRTLRNSQFEEVAVLVGDFASVEDANCRKMLEKIKVMQLTALGDQDALEDQSMRMFREAAKQLSKNSESKKKGPMGSAFVLPNPVLPDEYFAASPIDTTILKLNKGIDNSLLDCPGNFSVRVATFRGDSTIQLNEIEEEENKFKQMLRIGKPIAQTKLAEASIKCHTLCTELRKLGVEAYEFHDRSESYVCVGSYDWISKEDGTGGKIFNPEIEKTILLFKGSIENLSGKSESFSAKSLPHLVSQGIAFDVQPVPVAVPRDSAQGSNTAKNNLWGNTKMR